MVNVLHKSLVYVAGDWVVSILYEGKNIEGSPFNVRVYDPGQIRVIGLDGSLASRNYTFSGIRRVLRVLI